MTLNFFDRVKESSVTTGLSSISLAGALAGYRPFSSVYSNSDQTYYTVADQSGIAWECGSGTYLKTPNALRRDTVLASSNSGNLVNFTSGSLFAFNSIVAQAMHGRLLNVQVFISSATYTPTNGTISALIFCQGSGGGGGGTGTLVSGGNGGNGNTTSVGSIASANGGGGGQANSSGTPGLGGVPSSTGTGLLILTGSAGEVGSPIAASGNPGGASGGSGLFGAGSGAGGVAGAIAGGANTGAGGQGAENNVSFAGGGGGAAGALAIAYATGITGTYSVTIGAAGAAGAAGTAGAAAAAGATGVVIILEFA